MAVPNDASIRKAILYEFHDAPYSGHTGMNKKEKAVSKFFWWPKMKELIPDYIRVCPDCQRNKSTDQKQAGLLQPLPIPERRWKTITMDLITNLPRSKRETMLS